MTRSRLASTLLAALVTMLSACADTSPPPRPTASDSEAPSTLTASPAATPSDAGGLDLPEPDRPFDAAALLAAMRDSRRPDGVPDALETDAVASALAESIWTLDGEPWNTISAGGGCGPETCTLEISGAHDGAQGDDLWAFAVVPGTGATQPVSTDLRSMPVGLIRQLDTLARSLLAPAALEGLSVTSVRWVPPPDDGQFVLSYRSGGEEGSCGAEVTIDATREEIVSGGSSNC